MTNRVQLGNEVAILKDRIEIYNLGFFPDEIDPEDFFSWREHLILRNPLDALRKKGVLQRWTG